MRVFLQYNFQKKIKKVYAVIYINRNVINQKYNSIGLLELIKNPYYIIFDFNIIVLDAKGFVK